MMNNNDDSDYTNSPSSIKDGTGYFADTPGGSNSSTSVTTARDAYAKKRFFSGLSYDSSRSNLNSAPDSLADDWDLEDGNLEQVNVVVRVRPVSDAEKKRTDKDCVKIQHNSSSITLETPEKSKTFTFSAVFDQDTTQGEVLEKCGIKQMIEMAVDGYACTTFAYGQTGSGKTYTITGPINQDALRQTEYTYGLIQRSFVHLFDVLGQRSGSNVNYTLSASYLEIYNEQVKDLLNPSGRDSLPVRWSKDKGFYVENLFIVDCETLDDLLAILEEGMGQRQIATNNINEYSSRSHTIVSLQIDCEMPDPEEESLYITKHGRLSFVDLAGSEKVKELGNSSGELLTETTNINKSLLTLGNCISALSDNRKRSGHIPYRDSKLTKLLADSLGGNGITLMIACITPSSYCISESLSTLRYANRAKRIKNKPVIRMDPREKLILSLKREVKLLRNENSYLKNRLEFPSPIKPSPMRRNDTEDSLSIHTFSEDDLSGNRTPIPGDFDRSKGESKTPLQKDNRKERELKRRETDSSIMSSFTPKSAADSSLYEMLQEYMVENETLRSENSDLHNGRERAMSEHHYLSKENDKLLTKLDQLERVFAASPLSMNRTMSGKSVATPAAAQGRSQNSNASPSSQQDQQRNSSQSSSLLQSPDWQQGTKGTKPSVGGSGGTDRHSSGSQEQTGQLPPVDNKRGVPNGYRGPKPHHYTPPQPSYRPSSPPLQYHSQPVNQHHSSQQPLPQTHQSFPGNFKVGENQGYSGGPGGSRPGKPQHSHPPTQSGYKNQNDYGNVPDTSLSFPPANSHHSQPSVNSAHSLPGEPSPRGVANPRGREGPPLGETTTRGRAHHTADIYIPSLPTTSKENHRDPVGMKIEQASPQRDGTQQNNKLKNSPAKRVAKPAAGTTAPSQGVTGYSNRNKKNAWGQGGKSGGKPATKTQQGGEAPTNEQRLNSIPHTPAVTPPPVKYKPQGTTDLFSGDKSGPPPDPESLLEINQKLRQELLTLDGEIEYMKYVNKAKNNIPTTKVKGKRR
ncbi:kinesin-like protein KIF3A [Asterias rubens]|uniref:kinesin-like protein KIF3A n=1 Tax=Asterias rubens TaxID=7604 RepID=UPI001454F8E0|nr:kinesin-like protein KIF3A [Asterias rubens]